MSGIAALCPEFRFLHDGLELADSYATNPHKWMFTNFDCDAFYVADRSALTRALSVMPAYLENPASERGQVLDYRNWQVPLGRRFRALKLWFVIRHYGVEGLRFHLRRHVELAQEMAGWIRAEPRLELLVSPILSLLCFRHRQGERWSQALLSRLNASGALFLTHTRLGSDFCLRVSVGQTHTESRHLKAAWDRIQAELDALEHQGLEG